MHWLHLCSRSRSRARAGIYAADAEAAQCMSQLLEYFLVTNHLGASRRTASRMHCTPHMVLYAARDPVRVQHDAVTSLLFLVDLLHTFSAPMTNIHAFSVSYTHSSQLGCCVTGKKAGT